MLKTKGMRFPIDVILDCIHWYAAYPLSYELSLADHVYVFDAGQDVFGGPK